MAEKEMKIIEAAFRLFAHYGVNKTTMTEIADAANVARQTVYNSFSSKEELVFAALKHYAVDIQLEVKQGCEGLIEADARLGVLFKHLVQTPYEALKQLPHVDEILEIGDRFEHEKKQHVRSIYVGAIRIALEPFEQQLVVNGISPEQLYEFLKGTFGQIKTEARDAAHLVELFKPLKAMLLCCMANRAAR